MAFGLTYQDRLKVRRWYVAVLPEIMATRGFGIDKYKYPFAECQSPIEQAVWHECIRDGLVMYPEFPVGRYFVDLGNPRTKVAIECDGKEFHQDKHREMARESEITQCGWTVYRITGSEVALNDEWPISCEYDEHEADSRLYGFGIKAFVRRILIKHGNGDPDVSRRTPLIMTAKQALDELDQREQRMATAAQEWKRSHGDGGIK